MYVEGIVFFGSDRSIFLEIQFYFFIYSYYLEDIDVFLEFYNIDKKVCWSYVIVCI